MGVTVLDSMSFLSQGLATLPKTFQIEELQKGTRVSWFRVRMLYYTTIFNSRVVSISF